ncbi:DMT family transporter [Shouchella sp. 1P09AA]|uniref:DMT family transporter n=1 Tax=unclassified Shouchella TaxID=2893065 RepID=UPI0039A3B21C
MFHSRTNLIPASFAFLAVTFWGISFVSTKALLTELDPSTLLISRFSIGTLFLFVLLVCFRLPLKLSIRYIPHLFILGTLGVFIHQWLQSTALLTIHASDAGWMISLVPIFTFILAIIFLGERWNFLKSMGLLLAVIGVLLISSPTLTTFQPGHFFMLVSTLNWAVYSLLVKALRIPLPPVSITFYLCLIGTGLTFPLVDLEKSVYQLAALSLNGWSHLLFLGIFVSAVAYFLWASALKQWHASTVSSFLYFEPFITFLAAVFFLKEDILLLSLIGGIILIWGVLLSNHSLTFRKSRK